ncbi:MAG: hypothetical protein H6984_13750 [Pseudomonadales bacterium]|nr:hypothetical protein [Halioglobus sp.]MCP5123513.1 hypothetical protein [Pseudomonadales bacterium]MCP5193649.1 hypothetical protein [Pseudomonadales bacterium]
MESEYQFIWGLLFGAIGFGYFLYGRKQRVAMPFLSGIALCVFPYFVSNVYTMVLTGVVLLALPYFIRV